MFCLCKNNGYIDSIWFRYTYYIFKVIRILIYFPSLHGPMASGEELWTNRRIHRVNWLMQYKVHGTDE